MRRALLLLGWLVAFLLLAGCASGPITFNIDQRFNDDERAAMRRRFDATNALTNADHQVAFAADADADYFIASEDAGPDITGYHSPDCGPFGDGRIRIDPGLPLEQFERVLQHEVWHALGADHRSKGIMLKHHPALEPSPEDHDELRRIGAHR